MPIVFFWIGVVSTVFGTAMSFWNEGEDKKGVAIFPLTMFVAAVTAKYLGF